jgi:hypothetical protein
LKYHSAFIYVRIHYIEIPFFSSSNLKVVCSIRCHLQNGVHLTAMVRSLTVVLCHVNQLYTYFVVELVESLNCDKLLEVDSAVEEQQDELVLVIDQHVKQHVIHEFAIFL